VCSCDFARVHVAVAAVAAAVVTTVSAALCVAAAGFDQGKCTTSVWQAALRAWAYSQAIEEKEIKGGRGQKSWFGNDVSTSSSSPFCRLSCLLLS